MYVLAEARNLVRAYTIFWSSAVIPDAEQYRAIWLNQSCKCILFSEPANVGGSGTLAFEAMFPLGSLVSSP